MRIKLKGQEQNQLSTDIGKSTSGKLQDLVTIILIRCQYSKKLNQLLFAYISYQMTKKKRRKFSSRSSEEYMNTKKTGYELQLQEILMISEIEIQIKTRNFQIENNHSNYLDDQKIQVQKIFLGKFICTKKSLHKQMDYLVQELIIFVHLVYLANK